jgi:uncharacterized protein with von Willebrand factor type A (vWA) domain
MSVFVDNLLIFGRLLRGAGIDVHPGRMLDVMEALRHIDLSARDEVYHACRALLVHRHEQLPVFDRVFAAYWREHRQRQRPPAASPSEPRGTLQQEEEVLLLDASVQGADADDSSADAPPPEIGLKTWSGGRGISDKDFAALTREELAEAARALSGLEWNPGERRTRRWVRGRGTRIDLRRAVADSLRTGGEIVKLARRRRRLRPRPLVIFCDVSGSMERYSRMLLHFAHTLARRHHRVEAFLFSTRLTRITKQLRVRRPDAALAAVAEAVPDWSGGTRIGGAIKEFHQRWGRRALNGGPVVLLISDGWDRGDPGELRDQIARLHRRSSRLVWLNPLIGTTDYAPLTRGLQAALPFVDDFLPSRTLTNLADLAAHLNSLAASRHR